MQLELDFEKSVEENASQYFEQSKKAKQKLQRLEKTIQETKKKIKKNGMQKKEETVLLKKKKREWFHSFHWFFSSQGFLVIAGRSAKSNEQIVKKHLEKEDFFLHADIPGGAATVVKSNGKKIPNETLEEAAQFAAVFSKAWASGLPFIDVYAVPAGQVSKQAPTGTALATGSFMIYGKRQYFRKTALRLAVGLKNEKQQEVVSGPLSAIKSQADCIFLVLPGRGKASDAAKTILKEFKKCSKKPLAVTLDEIIQMLPAGKMDVRKQSS